MLGGYGAFQGKLWNVVFSYEIQDKSRVFAAAVNKLMEHLETRLECIFPTHKPSLAMPLAKANAWFGMKVFRSVVETGIVSREIPLC